MAANPITLSVDADVATRSDGLAAGTGDHLPIGDYSGVDYRSAIRFNPPAGWQSWTRITGATIKFYISDHKHVAPKNSAIYIRRMAVASPWTKSPGTQDCESGFSAANNTQYDDIAPVSTDAVQFSSGSSANVQKSVAVTNLVKAMWSSDVSKLVFVFDNVGSGDYTELWSEGKTGGYNATLVIGYEEAGPPTAPSLLHPNDEDVSTVRPTFSWTHHDPQGDAQTGADIEVYNGATLLTTLHPVLPTDTSVVCNVDLPRGVQLGWRARTHDATGAGAWSSQVLFGVLSLPVVTIDATRRMTFDPVNHQPRLVVQWGSSQTQTAYQVTTASGYDSGVIPGNATSHTLARNLVSGTAEVITVTSWSGAQSGSASRSFTPRYGLTTHRRDLVITPINWGTPSVLPGSQPVDTQLVIEYGSATGAATPAAPGAWFGSLSDVPKARWVFWRAWFIPSATQGPSLDSIVIPVDATSAVVDKWGTARDVATLAPPWSISPDEAVYGTRSMSVDCDGTAQTCYSFAIKVRAGRSYILTGLMKSKLNSGAHFRLEDSGGNILNGGGMTAPAGPVKSDVLAGTKDWFDLTARDVNRYKTVVWKAETDGTVYVVLGAQGVAGAKAWWDAIKLEESTVATPWSPGAIGATVIDAGGVQVDGSKGGVFRYKGTLGTARDVVSGGPSGLLFAGDTELTSPADGVLAIDTLPIRTGAFTLPVVKVYPPAVTPWVKPAGLSHIVVECVGGGGGGAGAVASSASNSSFGTGGGGGGYVRKTFLASALPASCVVTVGAGGGAGLTSGAPGAGGTSSFSGSGITTVQATGGAVGTHTPSSNSLLPRPGGLGGVGSGGDVNANGGTAPGGIRTGGLAGSFPGGDAIWGGGGGAVNSGTANNNISGNAGSAYGGGGSGGISQGGAGGANGGAGADGVVVVTEFYL